MPNAVEILITGGVVAVLRQLDPPHRVQFNRLIAALRLAAQAGVFYAHDCNGRVLFQVSGEDLHGIHTITYHTYHDRVFVIAIEIAEWKLRHTTLP